MSCITPIFWGQRLVHEDGTTLGTVVALYNFGAGEIIEVKPFRAAV
jgi:ribosomal 30S subunit maturation factor RimM